MKQRAIYSTMAAGGTIGLAASFLQTLEKMALLKNEGAQLACDVGSVFSCSNVLNAWHSSVFGFPNSLMCVVLFTIFGSLALAGAAGGKLTRGLRLAVHGLSVFTLLFGLWFLWQSTFVISSLCLYCLFCLGGLLLVNWGWLRVNADELPVGKKGRQLARRSVASDADTFIWILLALAIAFAVIVKFY